MCVIYYYFFYVFFNLYFSFFCVYLVKQFVLSLTKFQRCCEVMVDLDDLMVFSLTPRQVHDFIYLFYA